MGLHKKNGLAHFVAGGISDPTLFPVPVLRLLVFVCFYWDQEQQRRVYVLGPESFQSTVHFHCGPRDKTIIKDTSQIKYQY